MTVRDRDFSNVVSLSDGCIACASEKREGGRCVLMLLAVMETHALDAAYVAGGFCPRHRAAYEKQLTEEGERR
jgi:hypothetical protein